MGEGIVVLNLEIFEIDYFCYDFSNFKSLVDFNVMAVYVD